MSDIEKEIQAKGLTAPRVTPADIEASIVSEFFFTALDGVAGRHGGLPDPYPDALGMVTMCVIFMANGTKVVGVNTGPVSRENFDAELAKKLARKNATDQIWPMMGYALRERLAGGPCDCQEGGEK